MNAQVINPRYTCAARVRVLGLCVYEYTGNIGNNKRYQQLQYNKCLKNMTTVREQETATVMDQIV